MDPVLKPSLKKFLLTFSLKGVKNKGTNWSSLSTKASRKRKFIRENISDDMLDKIMKDNSGKKYKPFSSFSYLNISTNSDGSIGYKISAIESKIVEIYMDILDSIIKGYKAEMKKEGS